MVDTIHRNIRKTIFLYYRIRNRLSAYYNRMVLFIMGVKYGKNCMIQGKFYIKLFPTAKLIIGDNLHYSSGWNINALCSNRRGGIYATSNAVVKIGDNCGLSSTVFWTHKYIEIGNNVKIGGGSILIDTDSHNLNYIDRRNNNTDTGVSSPIYIGDDVLIGMNTVILKGVSIGARTVIGANSVVTKSIPSDCIAAGNPARVVRYLNAKN